MHSWLFWRMHADKGIDVRVYMRMDMHMVMCTQMFAMNMSMGMYKAVHGHVDEHLYDCCRHVYRHFLGRCMDMRINI